MVIPIHDQNPVRRTPIVTYLLIAINAVVFIFLEPISKSIAGGQQQTFGAACRQLNFFDRWAAIPKELITNHQLPPGARTHTLLTTIGPQTCPVPVEHKVPVLSVLYSMFLHGSWLHLLGNMLFLYVFGNNIEDRFGRVRYLLFYLLCGYAAAYGFALVNIRSFATLIGASGAIAGVLGAYIVLFPRARVTSLVPFFFFIPLRLPAWVVLGSWFLLQAVYSAGAGVASGAGVAYVAHVVGFIVGALITYAVGRRRSPPAPVRTAYDSPW